MAERGKPLRRFARVNVTSFLRLLEEEASFGAPEGVHEGRMIEPRPEDDRRETAFAGWAEGRSARDLYNRLRFAVSREKRQLRSDEPRKARLRGIVAQGEHSVNIPRVVFIAEDAFRELCGQVAISDELLHLEAAQQPTTGGARGKASQERREWRATDEELARIDKRADALVEAFGGSKAEDDGSACCIDIATRRRGHSSAPLTHERAWAIAAREEASRKRAEERRRERRDCEAQLRFAFAPDKGLA